MCGLPPRPFLFTSLHPHLFVVSSQAMSYSWNNNNKFWVLAALKHCWLSGWLRIALVATAGDGQQNTATKQTSQLLIQLERRDWLRRSLGEAILISSLVRYGLGETCGACFVSCHALWWTFTGGVLKQTNSQKGRTIQNTPRSGNGVALELNWWLSRRRNPRSTYIQSSLWCVPVAWDFSRWLKESKSH